MNTEKVANEVAEQEFKQWAEAMDLDLDTADMDAEDLAGFVKLERRLIQAIERGALVFNEKGEAVYTPGKKSKETDPITFHERTGASIMAMDGKKKGYDAAKMYAMMGEMCKVHPKTFANLVGLDIKICEALFQLLMD